MKIFFQVIKGFLVGAGAILPGISSGVICVALGLYEKILNAILDFFKNAKENIKFLLPLAFGAFIGIVVFGNALKYVFLNHKSIVSFGFIGLILGSIPSIIKQAQINKFRLHHFLALILSFVISIYFVLEQKYECIGILSNTSGFSFILIGFAMSVGVIIPGISSTVILMLFGVYEIYLNAVASLDLNILFPLGIGMACGSILLLLFIKFMLCNFKDVAYSSIIGFVLGSILILIPEINSLHDLFIGIILLSFGLVLSIKLSALH